MNLQTKLLIYLCLFAIIDIILPILVMSILLNQKYCARITGHIELHFIPISIPLHIRI
jgi:hypothetical protein